MIDLQKGIVTFPSVHPISEVIKTRASWPMLSVRTACQLCWSTLPGERRAVRNDRAVAKLHPGWTDLIPELNQQPGDIVVTKRTWGAFRGRTSKTN